MFGASSEESIPDRLLVWPVPVFVVLAALGVVKVEFTDDKARFRDPKARALMNSRASRPWTFDEYLYLFPDACRRCGCRSVVKIMYGTKGDDHGFTIDTHEYQYCERCGADEREQEIERDWARGGLHWTTSGEPHKYVRVQSPYLTCAESEAIPDWAGATEQARSFSSH